MKMVKGFESMLAGSLDLEEPWYITGAEFNPVKNVIDVHVGIREDAVIACPHCGVQQVTAPFERQNSRHTLLFEGYAMMIMADVPRRKSGDDLRGCL